MKRILLLLAVTRSLAFGVVMDAADFGLKSGEDAVPAIRRALEACKEQGASKLVIPKGTYDFRPERATEKFLKVSNNDNGLRRIVFPLDGFSDFEIDAQGSLFMMHGPMVPFDIHRSENITLRNFSIDWKKPFYFQGEVIATNAAENSFDLKVFDECDYQIVADELVFLEKPGTAVHTWKQWPVPLKNNFGWEQNIDWNIWYDSKTKAPAYQCNLYILRSYNAKLKTRYRAQEVEPGVVRIFDAAPRLPKPGWVLIIKGRKDKNRTAPAIHVSGSKNFHIVNVDVHHAGGMGFICERSENVRLENFNVTLPPGSGRMVSTTADATHSVNCKGLISYNDCHFENMLDDAANFHGIYTTVAGLVDEHTIGVNRMHGQQMGFEFAAAGDAVRLSESRSMKPYATLHVEAVNELNNEYMEIRCAEKVSDILRPDSVADNASWQADVLMENCTVRRNRARSILISTAGNVRIENNRFETCTGPSLLFEGDGTFWYESGPVRNVVIRNNHFKDFGLGSGDGCIIRFSPKVAFDGAPTHYYHRNIVFENNTCEVFGRSLASALSVENLVFRGNTILPSGDYPPAPAKKDVFRFRYCRNVRIENNDYRPPTPAKVVVDEYSSEIKLSGNKRIEE